MAHYWQQPRAQRRFPDFGSLTRGAFLPHKPRQCCCSRRTVGHAFDSTLRGQGTGSARTGTPVWGVHAHTASRGSPGRGVCMNRHMCVGYACTHNLAGLTRARRQFCARPTGGEAFLAQDEGRARGRPGSRQLNALFSSLRSLDFANSYYVKAFLDIL